MVGSRKALSVFSGAGGLDLGLERAGFKIVLCVERDQAARQTLSLAGQKRPLARFRDLLQSSPKAVLKEAAVQPGDLALVAAGPPCQPFSKAAYWRNGDTRRLDDPRGSTITALLALIELALPEAILIENVKGLGYRGKDEGLALIEERLKIVNRKHGTRYEPVVLHLNAVAYGVPQKRERVFVVAHRGGSVFKRSRATHADPRGALNGLEPYRTAWDAIGDLDCPGWAEELRPTGKYADFHPSIPEGQNYLWHTSDGIERWGQNGRGREDGYWGWRTRFWSFLLKLAKDQPSWTISANPGPSTGPFHWKSRLLSIRELCRLQTFPDRYLIAGRSRSEKVRQIGNAVPPALGELLGLEIRRQFLGETRVRRKLKLIPRRRDERPGPEPVMPVPAKFNFMKGDHPAHGGTGKGPAAQRRGKSS